MIKEDYVSLEVAKLLKEKGFDVPTYTFYNPRKSCFIIKRDSCLINRNAGGGCVSAPTLQMAMKWLREEKKIGIEVNIIFDFDDDHKWYYKYGFCIFQLSGTYKKIAECDYDGYKTYEEACEAAIKFCLENLI